MRIKKDVNAYAPVYSLTFRIDQPLARTQIGRGQLLLHLANVLRMDDVEPALAEQIGLRVVEYLRHRIGHVQDAAAVAVNDKQKSIGRLHDEHFEFLVGQKGGLVVALGERMGGAADRLQVLHGHTEYGEFVQFARHRGALRYDGGQLGDVGVHFVAASLLDVAVVLPGGHINGI